MSTIFILYDCHAYLPLNFVKINTRYVVPVAYYRITVPIEAYRSNATLYAQFSERRRGLVKTLKKKRQNATEFLSSMLHYANSFSML